MKIKDVLEKTRQNKKTVGAAVAVALAVIVLLLALACCSTGGNDGRQDNGAAEAVAGLSASPASSSGSSESGASNAGENSSDSGATVQDNQAVRAGQDNNSGSESPENLPSEMASNGQTGGSSDSSPSQGDSPSGQPQKRWVDDYENVWVVDSPAWTETVPIYENRERSICNICGADITGNTSAHGKEHMKAGQGSGHHSEVQRVQVGTNIVKHPEEGHWESRVVGGHWE